MHLHIFIGCCAYIYIYIEKVQRHEKNFPSQSNNNNNKQITNLYENK